METALKFAIGLAVYIGWIMVVVIVVLAAVDPPRSVLSRVAELTRASGEVVRFWWTVALIGLAMAMISPFLPPA